MNVISRLDTESLHYREHGVIVDATGFQVERIGEISDANFIPGITEVKAHVTYVPSQL